MNHADGDLDILVARLRAIARQHEDAAAEAPPPRAHRDSLLKLLSRRDPAEQGIDKLDTSLEHLFAALLNDERFLARAYWVLMGREVDEDGLAHYLGVLPKAGRLYVLADLLCADETKRSLAKRQLKVPRWRWLSVPVWLGNRLGVVGRLVRPPLRIIYRGLAVAMRPRLMVMGRLSVLEARARQLDELTDVLLEMDLALEEAGQDIAALDRSRAALFSALQHHRRAVERLTEGPPPKVPANREALEQQLFDAYYLAFEDACRGSEAQIREHLLNYAPQLDMASRAGTRALDLGCGRGEWLSLLSERGFSAHGADLNVAMVEHCQERGFEVAHADLLAALSAQPDNSHALVSAFHLAEHLPFDVLYRMVDEAQRVLAPGGVLIIETPNPENLLVGSHTFYHDPTHRNPLTPTAMTFLLEYHGLGEVQVRRFNPYPESAKVPGDDPLTERVNGHLCGPQDFAVVGVKVAPAAEEATS
ncbi:bifunctional 2-polyprenyl-6-hydroxyphenol methylase/3-demethylubiquinol 3-O-methyltransferase UbiG [Halomonas sp. A11-A]|uniref:class I SAM-dependent methyltransferase n=1 Tax=Halomonas sp. A11-A TaxID=2183985 RepID=UPI000D81246C|nr:class I SAM-dependent methyltransferase [Halomonas sp. A11-A]PWV72646.1 O-antigen chain-terminating methyltransferase [Halomonas sp. A11-A]